MKMQIDIPEPVHTKFKVYAAENHVCMKRIAVDAIAEYVHNPRTLRTDSKQSIVRGA